jgi:hypothetical protein
MDGRMSLMANGLADAVVHAAMEPASERPDGVARTDRVPFSQAPQWVRPLRLTRDRAEFGPNLGTACTAMKPAGDGPDALLDPQLLELFVAAAMGPTSGWPDGPNGVAIGGFPTTGRNGADRWTAGNWAPSGRG